MLLKRIAKINIKSKIRSYLNVKKYESLPDTIAAKKAFKLKSPHAGVEEIMHYTKYCLENTANPDEEFIATLQELLEKCEQHNVQDLEIFLEKL